MQWDTARQIMIQDMHFEIVAHVPESFCDWEYSINQSSNPGVPKTRDRQTTSVVNMVKLRNQRSFQSAW